MAVTVFEVSQLISLVEKIFPISVARLDEVKCVECLEYKIEISKILMGKMRYNDLLAKETATKV